MTKFVASKLLIAVFCVFWFADVRLCAAQIIPEDILKRVDAIRYPVEDYTALTKITSYRPGKPPENVIYEIRAKGVEKTVLEALRPASERGKLLLMADSFYWFFYPEVSQPVRVLAQGRFWGDIFNSDIARAHFYGDYSAKILREEFSVEKKYYIVELNAKNENAVYEKVFLWVEQKQFWPLKADFYTKKGRLLKTCFFENYKMFDGVMRPSKLVIKDAVVEGQYSTVEYKNFEIKKIPAKYFSKEYLKKKVF